MTQNVGVRTYIKNSLQYSILDNLTDSLGFSNIIEGNVYLPPCSDNAAMLDCLMNCMSSMESKRNNSGIRFLKSRKQRAKLVYYYSACSGRGGVLNSPCFWFYFGVRSRRSAHGLLLLLLFKNIYTR